MQTLRPGCLLRKLALQAIYFFSRRGQLLALGVQLLLQLDRTLLGLVRLVPRLLQMPAQHLRPFVSDPLRLLHLNIFLLNQGSAGLRFRQLRLHLAQHALQPRDLRVMMLSGRFHQLSLPGNPHGNMVDRPLQPLGVRSGSLQRELRLAQHRIQLSVGIRVGLWRGSLGRFLQFRLRSLELRHSPREPPLDRAPLLSPFFGLAFQSRIRCVE